MLFKLAQGVPWCCGGTDDMVLQIFSLPIQCYYCTNTPTFLRKLPCYCTELNSHPEDYTNAFCKMSDSSKSTILIYSDVEKEGKSI